MPFRVRRKLLADSEFLALSVEVRETFITAFHALALADDPVQRGRDWYVEETRQNQRVAREGLFSLHVMEHWRGSFFRRGRDLVFFGFGPRIGPGEDFYRRLARLREAVERLDDER
ncbi:MAG: hypothetical protein KGJ23_11380 [Euryarchaeota archaeon]|nr:hypothetical protein [Euryarchaeota archaeon]MDE1837196.1 hypothetical protein [Euryarchaeota archaeon]MDE1882082.1 hypothetical protein [Euryarchaeota archaeon]MDE2045352.1 hypothetical protein [Thermoplasmata archaeon]